MPEPDLREKTLTDCADSLERIYTILQDLSVAISEHYPGLSLAIGDYSEEIKREATFLREY